MDNVVDFFTRRRFPKQDTAANDREAVDFGKYIGVLPKVQASAIRDHTADIDRKRAQIEALMADFTVMWENYYFQIVAALSLLGVSMGEFNPDTHELYVDKNGHCWLVDTDKRDLVH